MKKYNIIIYIVLAGVIAFFVNDYFHQRKERKREATNYENSLKEKANELVNKDKELIEYQFKSKKELDEYLKTANNQFNYLLKEMKANNIKLRRISKLVGTIYKYQDTTKTIFNYDSLAQKIKLDQDFNVPFTKRTECLVTEGRHIYKDGYFRFSIDKQTLTDTIISSVTWKRKKVKWLLGLRFGKKEYDTKTISKCVDPNTIIIDIKKR